MGNLYNALVPLTLINNGLKNMISNMMTKNLNLIDNYPKPVGYWKFPGANIYWSCVSKPNIFHRTMMRIILGLKWRDQIGTESQSA